MPAAVALSVSALVFAATVALPAVVARSGRSRSGLPTPLPAEGALSLDVLVPAYLESTVIGQKVIDLRRTIAASSAHGRVVVIASDPATAAAARHAGADIVLETGRMGKAAAINLGVASSEADVVVFSDANCRVEPVAWFSRLLSTLEVHHLVSAAKHEEGGAEGPLNRIDALIRRGRSDVHESSSVFGEFVALRRADFVPLPEHSILDDVALGLSFGSRDMSVVVDRAIRTYEPAPSASEQWGRRVRIAEGLLTETLPDVRTLLRFHGGRVFAAHKLARVTVATGAFWTGACAATLALLPLTLIVPAALAFAVLGYAGRFPMPLRLRSLASVVGLQAVPIAAAGRVVSRRLRPAAHVQPASLWEKVER